MSTNGKFERILAVLSNSAAKEFLPLCAITAGNVNSGIE